MAFGRKTHSTTTTTTDDTRARRNTASNITGRGLLALSQLGTALAFVLVFVALAISQHKLDNLNLGRGAIGLARQAGYAELFQSGQQVPYPNDPSHQLAFKWYTLAIEIFTWFIIFGLLVAPRVFWRFKYVALMLLTYCFVLVTYEVQSTLFFHRQNAANQLFGHKVVSTGLAGLIITAITNGLSIFALGMLCTTNAYNDPNARPSSAAAAHDGYHGGKYVDTTGTTGTTPVATAV